MVDVVLHCGESSFLVEQKQHDLLLLTVIILIQQSLSLDTAHIVFSGTVQYLCNT